LLNPRNRELFRSSDANNIGNALTMNIRDFIALVGGTAAACAPVIAQDSTLVFLAQAKRRVGGQISLQPDISSL
jgi:hypothetical protein